MTTARDLVTGYISALRTAAEAVRTADPSLGQLADLLRLARSRRISNSGEAGGYLYKVHGAGCRLTHRNEVAA